jgi:hypothetical protein
VEVFVEVLWSEGSPMSKKTARGRSASNRRVGRVTVYLRGEVWYVYYYENGQRVRRRLGGSWLEAKQLTAQVNGQLATGAPAMLSFEPVSIPELRQRWLDHHEHVLRSSVATIRQGQPPRPAMWLSSGQV